jgi:hypothetical protein
MAVCCRVFNITGFMSKGIYLKLINLIIKNVNVEHDQDIFCINNLIAKSGNFKRFSRILTLKLERISMKILWLSTKLCGGSCHSMLIGTQHQNIFFLLLKLHILQKVPEAK